MENIKNDKQLEFYTGNKILFQVSYDYDTNKFKFGTPALTALEFHALTQLLKAIVKDYELEIENESTENIEY